MPSKIRILIVEDEPVWSDFLEKRYHFEVADILGVDRNFIERDRAHSFDEAMTKLKAARGNPYDLISLDINLGGSGDHESPKDGLHLLGEIAKKHAAWMVAILTGIEKDAAFKGSRATVVQRNLRNLAMQTFPPERLVILEKPAEFASLSSTELPSALAESTLLGNRIKQVVSIFDHTTSYRNVFRKLILANQYKEHAKESDDAEFEDNEPEVEAGVEGASKKQRQKMEWREGEVVHWQIRFDCGEMITVPEKTGMDVIRVLLENEHKIYKYAELEAAVEGDFSPTDEENAAANEVIFGGAGAERTGNIIDIDETTRAGYNQALRELEAKIPHLQEDPQTLKKINSDIKALRAELNKLRKGVDTKEAQRIRAHKSRVIASLREQGLVDFADHLDDHIRADRGTISYWPPADMNWQTE